MVSQQSSCGSASPLGSSNRAGSSKRPLVAAALLAVLALGACGGPRIRKKIKLPPPINPRIGWTQTGVASWYGHPYHGRKTSNGETYDMNKMTSAHKRLPFDTWLRVENLSNGRTTQVRINDRGPFVGNRIIDLSRAAATDIQMISSGTARVRLTLIRPPGQSGRAAPRRRGRGAQPATRRQQGQFDIQIGVFANHGNAQALAARVAKWGHRTEVEQSSLEGQTRYRVLVLGGNRNQANERMQKLKQQGIDGILRPRRGN